MNYIEAQLDAVLFIHLQTRELYRAGLPSPKGRALFCVGLDRMLHLAHLKHELSLLQGKDIIARCLPKRESNED